MYREKQIFRFDAELGCATGQGRIIIYMLDHTLQRGHLFPSIILLLLWQRDEARHGRIPQNKCFVMENLSRTLIESWKMC